MENLLDTYEVKQTGINMAERTNSTKITELSFRENYLCVHLDDGRMIDAPLSWFPWLMSATGLQREEYEVIDNGRMVYWRDQNQHILLRDLLSGSEPCSQCWYRITYFK